MSLPRRTQPEPGGECDTCSIVQMGGAARSRSRSCRRATDIGTIFDEEPLTPRVRRSR
jgi:hypothetical protein